MCSLHKLKRSAAAPCDECHTCCMFPCPALWFSNVASCSWCGHCAWKYTKLSFLSIFPKLHMMLILTCCWLHHVQVLFLVNPPPPPPPPPQVQCDTIHLLQCKVLHLIAQPHLTFMDCGSTPLPHCGFYDLKETFCSIEDKTGVIIISITNNNK